MPVTSTPVKEKVKRIEKAQKEAEREGKYSAGIKKGSGQKKRRLDPGGH